MPSLDHEALVTLFRNRPTLAPELLRGLGVRLPSYTEVSTHSTDLTEVVPAEYRADLVVLLARGKPVFAIVVEVQLDRDARKRFTWPVYVAGLRARFRCPSAVLVVAPKEPVARWAASPIELGPESLLKPWVVGPEGIPVVTDPARAKAEPELSVLSAMAHGKGDVDLAVRIALAAAEGVERVSDPDLHVLYRELIFNALSQAARKAFQMLPEGYKFRTAIGRKSFAKGVKESKIAAVHAVLEARGVTVSSEQRARIEACTDIAVLDAWIRRAATITTADELFG